MIPPGRAGTRGLAAARWLEVPLTAAALVLLAPLLFAIALAIRMESPGPVLYREERLGQGGRPFELSKFRSLHVHRHAHTRVVPGGDPGITRVGRFLRRSHLDELPQLVAVLRGHMSLVGPRPERADIWSRVDSGLRENALAFRPGLTSPASLLYLCEDEVLSGYSQPDIVYCEILLPAKLRVDLEFLETRTPGADIRVLLATLARPFRRAEADLCRERVRALLGRHGAGVDRRDG